MKLLAPVGSPVFGKPNHSAITCRFRTDEWVTSSYNASPYRSTPPGGLLPAVGYFFCGGFSPTAAVREKMGYFVGYFLVAEGGLLPRGPSGTIAIGARQNSKK